MSTINIQPDDSWGEDALKVCCPVCGHDYAHHGDVLSFHRGAEDGPTVVIANRAVSEWEAAEIENPSPRRGAIRIMCDGECGHSWWLDIVQHKGQTFIFQRVDEGEAR